MAAHRRALALSLLLLLPVMARAAEPSADATRARVEAIRAADGVAIGTVREVRTVYDDQGEPTTVVRVEVERTVRGAAPPVLGIRVPGGPSRDGVTKMFATDNPVHWGRLVPGVEGWFAWRGDPHALVADPAAMIVLTRGRDGGTCATTAHGSVLLSVDPWRTQVRFPDGAPGEIAVVDCAGAPSFDDAIQALTATLGGAKPTAPAARP